MTTHIRDMFIALVFTVITFIAGAHAEAASLFDGTWTKTERRHTDCSYSTTCNITFTTDKSGITRASVDSFGSQLTGRITGRTYTYTYGVVNGRSTGRGNFTISTDAKSFTGTFSDDKGHKGTWTGRRIAVPIVSNNPKPQDTPSAMTSISGLWQKTLRKHTDCSYSTTANITFTTDKSGVTRATVDSFGSQLIGKMVGRTYTFEYGIVNGKPTGRGTFTFSADGKSFSGQFSDNAGHRGTWSGSR